MSKSPWTDRIKDADAAYAFLRGDILDARLRIAIEQRAITHDWDGKEPIRNDLWRVTLHHTDGAVPDIIFETVDRSESLDAIARKAQAAYERYTLDTLLKHPTARRNAHVATT